MTKRTLYFQAGMGFWGNFFAPPGGEREKPDHKMVPVAGRGGKKRKKGGGTLPRNPFVLPARGRTAGPMRERRTARLKEQWTKEQQEETGEKKET